MSDAAPGDPAALHREEVERWRAARLASLRSPGGWLSLVGLAWLSEGSNPIGSDPSNVGVLNGAGVAAFAGTIEVRGDELTIHAAPGSGVTHRGRPVRDLELDDDADGTPTILRVGSMSFNVIRRGDDRALRIRDADAPARRTFAGIPHWPVDPKWRILARFEPRDPPGEIQVPTIVGPPETYLWPGAVAFDIDDEPLRLEVFLEAPDEDLFLVFGDGTNRDDTYEGGRFLYTPQADADGVVVVDFNRAYNPPCVFTPYATCPFPLPENRLPIRIEAGERRIAAPST